MKLVLFLISILCVQTAYSQSFRLSNMLYNEYEHHWEESLTQMRFNQDDILPLIDRLKQHEFFEVKLLGYSIEKRPIYLISLGTGDTDVLMWSQMHGNEPTATMALFDLFNFFRGSGDSFVYTRQRLLRKLKLHFIPMLNPDGAEIFSRYNAIGIDLNRDALRLTTPEAQILQQVQDSLKPEFGFNLHDQSVYYSAGDTSQPATISFLAPAYDFEQNENEVRLRAMKLIAYLNSMLQQHIPGGVAKYSDAHEPRAFGDNIQKWGTSTILIESGGYPDDPEKQYIRKLNFVTLLTAFDAIAEGRYLSHTREQYFEIPQNRSLLSDLIIRNAEMPKDGNSYLIDLSIHYQLRHINDSTSYYTSVINEIGDLSLQYGYEEIDAEGLQIYPGEIYPDTLQNFDEVKKLNFQQLLKQGYTDVIIREEYALPYSEIVPVNIISAAGYENNIALWHTPNLILKDGDDVKYAIVNGFPYHVEQANPNAIRNVQAR